MIHLDIKECPVGCPGCSCHISPPCSHCTDGHGEPLSCGDCIHDIHSLKEKPCCDCDDGSNFERSEK